MNDICSFCQQLRLDACRTPNLTETQQEIFEEVLIALSNAKPLGGQHQASEDLSVFCWSGAFVYGCATGQHSFLMSCFFTNQVFAQLGFDEVLEGIYGRRERGLFLSE